MSNVSNKSLFALPRFSSLLYELTHLLMVHTTKNSCVFDIDDKGHQLQLQLFATNYTISPTGHAAIGYGYPASVAFANTCFTGDDDDIVALVMRVALALRAHRDHCYAYKQIILQNIQLVPTIRHLSPMLLARILKIYLSHNIQHQPGTIVFSVNTTSYFRLEHDAISLSVASQPHTITTLYPQNYTFLEESFIVTADDARAYDIFVAFIVQVLKTTFHLPSAEPDNSTIRVLLAPRKPSVKPIRLRPWLL